MSTQQNFVELNVGGAESYRSVEPGRSSAFETLQIQFPNTRIAQMAAIYAERKSRKRTFGDAGITVVINNM